jgi:hypothetical protein
MSPIDTVPAFTGVVVDVVAGTEITEGADVSVHTSQSPSPSPPQEIPSSISSLQSLSISSHISVVAIHSSSHPPHHISSSV